MTKLLLALVIDVPNGLTINTSCRVFDRRSHKACDYAIRHGLFGNYSKSAYRLSGTYQEDGSEWLTPISFPVYRKSVGASGRQILDVPAVLADILRD